jgi:hypothetical protein
MSLAALLEMSMMEVAIHSGVRVASSMYEFINIHEYLEVNYDLLLEAPSSHPTTKACRTSFLK